MNTYTITPLVNEHCATGENPYWNPDDGCVYWTDIPNGKLFRYDPATGAHRTIYHDAPVGGFTLQADGNWLLFRVHDIALLTPDGQVTVLLPFQDETAKRFNDVIADPEGRVYAGTMGATPEVGGLYRVDLDGTITKLFAGTGTANGMGFTPDLQFFYWTDSTAKRLYRFRYDRATGDLTGRTVFYQADPSEGTPDGLAVDTGGAVWSARHRGGTIRKHAPDDGRIVETITMPVKRVTSLFLGGPGRDIAFVTSAGGGEPESIEADGTLYQITGLGATGLEEFRSRIAPA